MRKRFLFGLVGGLVGMSIKPVVNAFLNLSDVMAFALCGFSGILLASLISICVDVFSGRWRDVDLQSLD